MSGVFEIAHLGDGEGRTETYQFDQEEDEDPGLSDLVQGVRWGRGPSISDEVQHLLGYARCQ